MSTVSKTRALFSFYISAVFGILLTLEKVSVAQFALWTYSLGIVLFASTFLLPLWNPFKNKALQRTLMFACTFWVLSLIAWAFGPGLQKVFHKSELFANLAYLIVYGGFFAIVEGVYITPAVPHNLDDPDEIENPKMGYDGAVKYLRYEYEKWWKGVNMFWGVIIAIVVSGVIDWTIRATAPPLNIAFFLAFSSVPGIAMIVWYIIKKTNAIHESMGKIYEAKNEGTNEK